MKMPATRAAILIALLAIVSACASPRPAPNPTPIPRPTPAPAPTAAPAPGAPVLSVGAGQEFPSLEAARDALRRMRAAQGLPSGAIVEIHGIIQRATSFTLRPDDSGAPGAPIIYRSAPGTPARIIGGRLLDLSLLAPLAGDPLAPRFPEAARPHILRLALPDQAIRDYGKLSERNSGYVASAAAELIFNAQPLPLAGWPNQGWAHLGGPLGERRRGSLRFADERPLTWAAPDDAWVHGFFSNDYSDRYERIESIDRAARTITTSAAAQQYATYLSGQRVRYLNIPEELDTPGEWFLDRGNGTLYLWPPATIAAEAYLTLGDQPIIAIQGASWVVVEGLTIEGGRATAIAIEGGSDNLLSGLTIRNTGTDGAQIDGSSNGIVGSLITQTGDGGIVIGGGDRVTLRPSGNYARNNIIQGYARFVLTGRPGIRVSGVGALIENNLIADAPASAIMFSGNDHRIERNEITAVARATSDVGAIYTGRSWAGRGTLIRNNYIHDIGPPERLPDSDGAQAIYIDDYGSGITIVGNILLNTAERGIFINSGPLNSIEGNLIVGSRYGIYIQHRDWEDLPQQILEELAAFRYREPPYATRYPDLASIADGDPAQLRMPRATRVVGNLIANAAEPIWVAPSLPAGIIVEQQNLTLPADDPAITTLLAGAPLPSPDARLQGIGFLPIPLDQIGPQPLQRP